ncbi:MAG TPA: hypothetical protein V6C89_02930 [Drouetiella sp.]|jgi:hypothetical protein
MYAQPTNFTEIECWNNEGNSTHYWLYEEDLKVLIERIKSLAVQREETNRSSKILQRSEFEKLNYPIR